MGHDYLYEYDGSWQPATKPLCRTALPCLTYDAEDRMVARTNEAEKNASRYSYGFHGTYHKKPPIISKHDVV